MGHKREMWDMKVKCGTRKGNVGHKRVTRTLKRKVELERGIQNVREEYGNLEGV